MTPEQVQAALDAESLHIAVMDVEGRYHFCDLSSVSQDGDWLHFASVPLRNDTELPWTSSSVGAALVDGNGFALSEVVEIEGGIDVQPGQSLIVTIAVPVA